MKTIILALFIAISLSGCGGGARPNPLVHIQLFGDSTAYPPEILQQAMNEKYGYGVVSIEFRAMGGTDSKMLIDGVDGKNKPWPQSVDADIIIVNMGINDQYFSVTPEKYKDNLRLIASTKAKIFFQTPLPAWRASVLAPSYTPVMQFVAAELNAPIADAYGFALSLPEWYGTYMKDGIHPLDDGYRLLIAKVLMPAIDDLITSVLKQKTPQAS